MDNSRPKRGAEHLSDACVPPILFLDNSMYSKSRLGFEVVFSHA